MTEDILASMLGDLKKAMAKPAKDRHWIMVIDLKKCVGCQACTVACVSENKLPPGVVYRPVLEEEIGKYPNVGRRFMPRPCMQCEHPPCTPVCPVGATYKDQDSIIVVNYDQCIGCRYCITACPYAARTFDFGNLYTEGTSDEKTSIVGRSNADDYERDANFEYGIARERLDDKSPVGNVRKCHFCKHRLEEGMLPACVTTCIGRANIFGDANNPDSLAAKMASKPNVMRLKEEMGTEPQVYYLV